MSITINPQALGGTSPNALRRRETAAQELFYIDTDAAASSPFTARKAVFTIRADTGSSAPTNIQPTIHVLTRSKGDNATFIGATGLYVQTRDRTDVDGSNKGVLYGVQVDVNPLVARNNSPADDVDAYSAANSSNGFKATDAYYLARNGSAFGANREWITGFQAGGNCDFCFYTPTGSTHGTGLSMNSTFQSYGIDMKTGTFALGGIRTANNVNFLMTRNAADGADLLMLKSNTNNDVAIGNSGTLRVNCTASQIGFYGTTPVAKQTVTGAKGSNAALGSLMTALAAMGLVTDSTSA